MPDPTSQCLELHTLGKGEIPLDAQGGRQDIAVTRQSVCHFILRSFPFTDSSVSSAYRSLITAMHVFVSLRLDGSAVGRTVRFEVSLRTSVQRFRARCLKVFADVMHLEPEMLERYDLFYFHNGWVQMLEIWGRTGRRRSMASYVIQAGQPLMLFENFRGRRRLLRPSDNDPGEP